MEVLYDSADPHGVAAGVGMTFGQGGTVSDVFVSSELSATASMPGVGSTGLSAASTGSLESGPTLTGSIADLGGTIQSKSRRSMRGVRIET